jgi:MFS transporter, UMF1 family
MILKNNPRTLWAWSFFDCANSAHSLVIGTAVFPLFWKNAAPETIHFFGSEIPRSSMLAYALTIAYLAIALIQPVLSGIADSTGKRKQFMQFFTYLGAFSCISMFFMQDATAWQIGFWAYIFSMIGYAGGVVFNNAYIPDIATPDHYDRLSARGYSLGYLGSTLLLLATLGYIMSVPESEALGAMRYTFIAVGLWWLGFSLIPFLTLPADNRNPITREALGKGFRELRQTFAAVKALKQMKRFFFAFFFYDAGVQTLIFLASTFATDELKFEATELIKLVLMLQLVGALGAWLFAKISDKKGNKWTLTCLISVWVFIAFSAYFITDKTVFYGLGALLGFVMGGTQSLSRSAFSKLIPETTTDQNTFYAFFDLIDKFAVIVGAFLFGYIGQIMSLRASILVLAFFFLIGLINIRRVNFREIIAAKKG